MSRARSQHLLAGLFGIVVALSCAPALADPPARVARLSYVSGTVSFSPAADVDTWVQARLNRPLFIGDRLWVDRGSRAELELGTAGLRIAPSTSFAVLNIDDRISQIQIDEGRVSVRVRALAPGETFEVDTPNLAFVATAPGLYDVEVDPRGDATVVAIRGGRAEVYGERTSYVATAGQWYRFYGSDLDNDYGRVPPADEFDRWASARESRHERSISARYVSPAVIGYDDLDQYGTWTTVSDYGPVWMPRSVPADWAPYRNGHWSWIEPWGWTWVDDAPWGFAPFHYGRWALVNNRWGWVPGPRNVRPVYAPALVAFVGNENFSVSVGGAATRAVGWFPLAPGEVYRPAYRVSREYFTQVNVANTRVDNSIVTNVYSDPKMRDVRYRYLQAPRAITAVPVQALAEAKPVAQAAVRVDAGTVARVAQQATVAPAPPVAPPPRTAMGSAPPAPAKPPPAVLERRAVAKAPPPAAPPAFNPHDPTVPTARPAEQAPPPRMQERVRVVASPPATQPAATAEHRGAPAASAPGAGTTANVPAARPPATAATPANPPVAAVPPRVTPTPPGAQAGNPPSGTPTQAGPSAGESAHPAPRARGPEPSNAAPQGNRGARDRGPAAAQPTSPSPSPAAAAPAAPPLPAGAATSPPNRREPAQEANRPSAARPRVPGTDSGGLGPNRASERPTPPTAAPTPPQVAEPHKAPEAPPVTEGRSRGAERRPPPSAPATAAPAPAPAPAASAPTRGPAATPPAPPRVEPAPSRTPESARRPEPAAAPTPPQAAVPRPRPEAAPGATAAPPGRTPEARGPEGRGPEGKGEGKPAAEPKGADAKGEGKGRGKGGDEREQAPGQPK